MTDVEKIIEKLDQIINLLDKKSGKKQKFEKEVMTPIQKAVQIVTAKKSTDEEVKKSLNVLAESPQTLTPSQVAFCVYFLSLNKSNLGEDVNWWLSLEVGKHKFNERTEFIQKVVGTLEEKYRSNMTVVNGLKLYLDGFKKK